MSIACAGPAYRVPLPKVIQRGQRLLPMVARHGVSAQKLPAFIREKPEAGLPKGEKLCQPFKGRFGHCPVGTWRRSRFRPEGFEVGLCRRSFLALALFRFGQDAVAFAFPERVRVGPFLHFVALRLGLFSFEFAQPVSSGASQALFRSPLRAMVKA